MFACICCSWSSRAVYFGMRGYSWGCVSCCEKPFIGQSFLLGSLEGDFCCIQVHDKGKISDKPMGRAQVPVYEVAQRFVADSHLDDLVVNLPLETTAGSKGSKGDVVLHLEWIPLDNLPIPQPKIKHSESLFNVVERGVLMLRLVHARGLRNVDLAGKSDPYVIFKVSGGPLLSFVSFCTFVRLFHMPKSSSAWTILFCMKLWDTGVLCAVSPLNILRVWSSRPQ